MKHSAKQIITALLALMMLVPTLASCSDSADDNKADDTTTAADTASDTAAETTEARAAADVPAKDFGGYEYTFLTSGTGDTNGAGWQTYDFYAAEENGDPINDAVYARNLYISESFNVKIAEIQADGKTFDQARSTILAGDDTYDTVVTHVVSAGNLAQEGLTLDMLTMPYIDLDKEWWDGNMTRDLSIAGQMNYATGDITVMDNDAIWVLNFNKQMHKDYNLDSIYDLIQNNEWYYDTFEKMIKAVTVDVNGDGQYTHDADKFGMTTLAYSNIGLLYNFGLRICGKDEDDLPTIILDTEKASEIVERATALVADNSYMYGPKVTSLQVYEVFTSGRALFFGEVLMSAMRMRDSETDFGIVPWPKYNEQQDNYYHIAIPSATKVVTVPMTQKDTEMAGIILEAMAAESVNTLTPAYFDKALGQKYMRDEESIEMLDIILNSRYFDLAYAYEWAKFVVDLRTIISTNSGTFASLLASSLDKLESEMNATTDKYLAVIAE